MEYDILLKLFLETSAITIHIQIKIRSCIKLTFLFLITLI